MALQGGYTPPGMGSAAGSKLGIGSTFKTLFSGAPNAPIKQAKVVLPSRSDYGAPTAAPTIADPSRSSYGTPDATGLKDTRGTAMKAQFGFNNPRGTGAFKSLMGLAEAQTSQQVSEQGRHASDAAQRRGYSGGFEDSARQSQQDRMSGLASAGFAGADQVRQSEGEEYGRAIGAFTQLQSSYNEAKSAGDISFAKDLTATHLANAENTLKTAGLNMDQQQAFASGLNEAKMLQAKLDQDYNNSLIDNNRFIEGQQQISAQLLAQQMALQEKQREFDSDSAFKNKQFDESQRQFDLSLKANPNTALRTFSDQRYGGATGRGNTNNKSAVFTGLS